jgi:hypothetical protein
MCEAYDCKPMYHGKVAGQFVYKFMLNVKIQNQKTNVQSTNYMSRLCGVSCKNSTGFVSLIDYPDKSLSDGILRIQADSGIDVEATPAPSTTLQQNVGFTDLPNNVISDIPHPMNYIKVDSSQNIELGDFLKRPVLIDSRTWGIGNTLDIASDTFDPWHAFFSKASIKRKLDNYYMVRCNLHLKFVINASPFYYGCALVSYQPLINFNPCPVILSSSGRKENIPLSQRPHIYLYPQNCQGGEMVLPFLYYKNWLDATSSTDLTNMGRISYNSFNPLANANGVVSDNISIQVYAWAEDIEIAGPTTELAVQGKDEYSHDGVVSRPASAIARAADRLSSMPIIGEFATATSYAAGAVADIAALFGYTDVPVIDDVHAFQNKSFPNLAATDIGTPIEKLTLDSKNELSIDPKIAGVDVEDELGISSFVQRESYIYNSTWAASDPINTSLFHVLVSPDCMARETVTGGFVTWQTPMSYVSKCFRYWRGDITYRFKFICSKYHRGRVRINWAPHGDIGTSGDYTTEVYTKIVDITEENDVEFTVPYTQLTSYLRTADATSVNFSQSSTSTALVNVLHNGILTVRVLNEQSSPVTSADIQMLVFVRGSDNLEFATPTHVLQKFSPYAVQGDVGYDTEPGHYELGVSPSVADKNINLTHMGESIVSLRTLMRRATKYVRINTDQGSIIDEHITYLSVLGRSPAYPGFDPNGLTLATGIVSSVNEPFNWTLWNATTWFSLCFVGSRGSYHYIVNPSLERDTKTLIVSRSTDTFGPTTFSTATTIGSSNTAEFERSFALQEYESGMSGMTLISQTSRSGAMVSIPMYSRYKFLNNSSSTRTKGSSVDESDTDAFSIQTDYSHITGTDWIPNPRVNYTDLYVSAGTDFSLVFFLNIPSLYYYGATPAVST